MTNLPFGFNTGDGDDDPDQRPGGSGAGGFGPEGFDLSQLGSMLSQLGQMMSEAGGPGGTAAGPVNYEMAQKIALQAIPASHPASAVDVDKVREAVQLAELWLDAATSMPVATRTATAWSARQWVEQTMPNWQALCTPIAERVASSWTESLPQEMASQVGPLLGMLGSMGAMTFGTQLGQGLAQLSGEVLTSTDVGLPLGPSGTAALLPRAIAEFSQGLSIDEDQVRLYLAAREAAHHRLYAAAPWLRDRVIALVQAYASGIAVDFSEMEDLAQKFDPQNPAAIQELLSGQGMAEGMFEPKISAGQQTALRNLETLLALVEGWVDTVVTQAVGERLPGAGALQETMRRRRAAGGPSEQAFESLIGLQMRPRRLRAAAELWQAVGESRGNDGRDALWADPDLLPGADDLDDPTGFVKRDKEFNELLAGLDGLDDLSGLTIGDEAKSETENDGDDETGGDDGEASGSGDQQPPDPTLRDV
ncbi:zinc-dependent metalloprotease [Nakamurella lactea]|uniref:zinc-dependent metalloprotease n=1 Tax=Nakamurella lactea TaxID=459515 RepID=UPI000415AE04|nr:zinc-dependent metalloprotease [Nakamurella lactea]